MQALIGKLSFIGLYEIKSTVENLHKKAKKELLTF
jgi:hypothetical protein